MVKNPRETRITGLHLCTESHSVALFWLSCQLKVRDQRWCGLLKHKVVFFFSFIHHSRLHRVLSFFAGRCSRESPRSITLSANNRILATSEIPDIISAGPVRNHIVKKICQRIKILRQESPPEAPTIAKIHFGFLDTGVTNCLVTPLCPFFFLKPALGIPHKIFLSCPFLSPLPLSLFAALTFSFTTGIFIRHFLKHFMF